MNNPSWERKQSKSDVFFRVGFQSSSSSREEESKIGNSREQSQCFFKKFKRMSLLFKDILLHFMLLYTDYPFNAPKCLIFASERMGPKPFTESQTGRGERE
ncbi:hypothetical protein NC652_010143 [Populus alba x Populus x berolinensis]|uniref:Uncharacterized protein n=1 Tax=Populus alba x Populus x berolinensis TaxID=444605 RepID=A0AAD6R0Q3_9ROSI|nr:hypothetical protein NC652_010143 [Populus alba x Populus x berolinensis]KAJ6999412.1 hypothetical protein NC653_010187 [Populus alba x Populus x berolinensis]